MYQSGDQGRFYLQVGKLLHACMHHAQLPKLTPHVMCMCTHNPHVIIINHDYGYLSTQAMGVALMIFMNVHITISYALQQSTPAVLEYCGHDTYSLSPNQ